MVTQASTQQKALNGFLTPQSKSKPAPMPAFPQPMEHYLPPLAADCQNKKTLVLDLDETLVHSAFQPVENVDIVLPV